MDQRNDLIPVGDMAPDFTAQISNGETMQLSALYGQKRVVLVFYPGDNTPGCTAQLCALRDTWSDLQAKDTAVYGVNPAGVGKHAGFVAKHGFPFPLIADTGGRIAAAYGSRALFGLIRRTVYVLDKRGRVAFAQRGNPTPHEILQVLQTLEQAEAATP